MINSPEFPALIAHQKAMRDIHLRDLFAQDAGRAQRFSVHAGPLFIDYSKHRINTETLGLLQSLAESCQVSGWRARMLGGEAINSGEGRAALHVALRGNGPESAQSEARRIVDAMSAFTRDIISGKNPGATGKAFTDVIHIGIGGSDLGPRLVVDALANRKEVPGSGLRAHFVANIDPHELDDVLHVCDPATTLVIVISKSFGTAETLLNARHARDWLESHLGPDVGRHLVAVTNNVSAATRFGMPAEQILHMPEWVGGRFSLWSAVGLSIMLALGTEQFEELLAGAAEVDTHFSNTPLTHNAPVILALLTIWYGNFWGTQAHAVLPYSQRLRLLPDYLQQLEMESNGKRIGRSGDIVGHATAPIIFGGVGANSQHSFHQLLHQGTHLIPSDFVVLSPMPEARSRMLAVGALAQTAALMQGDANAPQHYPGNQPSTTIMLPALNARSLGALLALYEHKIFVEGILWRINSFDQPGVELGKRIADSLLAAASGGEIPAGIDGSTRQLLGRINRQP